MGKRSRHRARVVKAAEPPPAAVDPAPTGLHITVAAITDLHELDLRHETELVKSALLYADRVTLASPKVALMASIAGFATLDRRKRIDAMAELIGVLDTGQDAVRLYSDLRRRRQRLSPHERKLLAGMESRLDSSSQDVMAQVDQLLEQAGAGELARALELGLVELHGLGVEQADARNLTDVVIEALADVLAESVGAAARTFPLFDNDAGDLMRAMVAEGKVVEPRTARSKEAGAAGRLIAGIDAFPSAAMDDLIDVRQQLARPLTRFRAALAKVTAEFESAAWEDDFEREVEDLYRQEVAPALLDVEEALGELGARPTLLRLASSKESVAAVAAGLGVAAASAVGYADLPAIVYGMPGAPLLLAAGADEARHRRDARRSAAQNSFYFLYAANRQLA